MGAKGGAPSAPDPYQAAQSQYIYGTQAANYNMGLNAVNQVTPTGSTTWSVNPGGVGSNQNYGTVNPGGVPQIGAGPGDQPNGITHFSNGTNYPSSYSPAMGAYQPPVAPQYTETQTLNPNEQALLTGREQLGLQSQGLGNQAGQNVGQVLNGYQMPTEGQNGLFGAQAMRSAYGTETATMDPYWNQEEEKTDAALRNSGAQPGSPAYDNAMQEFRADRNNAYLQAENQAFGQGLSAQGQEISDVNQAQGGPIANYLSLLQQSPGGAASVGGGGGGGAGSPSGSVSAPNFMQALENQYQGQLASYNSDVATSNADTGALASLGAAAIIAASDKRLKTDIQPIGAKTPRGNPLYSYRFNFQGKDAPKTVGVMAQEAEKNTPDAVLKDARGIRYVDYARA